MGIAVCLRYCAGIGRLRQAQHKPFLLVYPIIEKAYASFLLNGQVLLMGLCHVGSFYRIGSKLVHIEEEGFAAADFVFHSGRHLE